jgi:hypothetical protein
LAGRDLLSAGSAFSRDAAIVARVLVIWQGVALVMTEGMQGVELVMKEGMQGELK